MKKTDSIYIAGHRGLVGSALVRTFTKNGYTKLITKTRSELDLLRQEPVEAFFKKEKPDVVILTAAKVGGIQANRTYRADFIYQNLTIQNNVIHAAYQAGVKQFLFLGSSCIYPRACEQPMREEHLLTGDLEKTNEPYAIAKIAGLKMCESYNRQYDANFLAVMPSNLYGPNDNFNLETSHLLPAFLRKFHLAKLLRQGNWAAIRANLGVATDDLAKVELNKHGIASDAVTIWGTGKSYREFMHSDDLAEACLFLLERPLETLIDKKGEYQFLNIGTGVDHTILDIAKITAKAVGFDGEIRHDLTKPDGIYRKLLAVNKLEKLGWKHRITLEEGVASFYQHYLANQ
jgi:GDP-L-fucose synthase